jgi:hypothetical protein
MLVLATMSLVPGSARAQRSAGGYLLGAPSGTFTIRTGYDAAMANSDLFAFVTNELTLRKRDFASPMLAADFGFRLNSNVDATFGAGYSRGAARSEFRDWLDNNNLPIEQQTEFIRVPLTVNLKAYLEPPGRAIGHYAWIPAKFAPYVGGGVGTMWYRFRQSGDFIDFNTTEVYPDTYSSSAWTPMANAFVGSDFGLRPGLAFNVEARYSWARGPLSRDFSGFHRLDLSGIAFTAGVTFRY